MPKMPTDKEANARSQPTDGLLSLRKRSQVGRRQPEAAPQGGRSQASSLRGDRLPRLESSQATRSRHAQTDGLARRVALPRSGATREEATRMPALTPLPRPAAAARHAPAARLQGAASARCKLPPLPAAPATSAARGRETSTGTAASGHRRIVPSAQGVRGDQGTAARAQVQRPAPLSPTARAAAVKGTARCLRSEVPGKVAAASRRPSQQPEARRDGAHSTAVATTARTDEVGAADGGAAPTAQPALAEEEEWEEDSDKELSREDFTTDNIWVNPSVPELFQDPHAGPQEGRSSKGEEAAGEPQSASPAPAVLTDAEPADSALDGAPEEEEHHTTLTPTVQDEAKSPASPVFGEQDTASVAESQTPTPHSSTSSVAVLCDIADCIVREVLMEVLAAQKIRSQQPAEQQDQVHSMAVATAETAHEVRATDSSEDEAPAAQPALAEEEEWEENSDKELSRGEDFTINTIWVSLLVPELFQDPHAGPQEGPSSKGEGAAGEPQSASPAPAVLTDAEPADSALDGAAEEEEHHTTLSPTVQDEAKSPASPVFGEQDTAAAAAERQTPTPHSSTSSVAVLCDIADCIVREVLMEVLAAQKIRSQQPAEQQDQVHSMAVATAETAHEVRATDSSEDEAPAAQPALAEEEEWEENSDKELSRGEDFTINTIWVSLLVPELFQDPHAGPQEGRSSKGEEAAGEPQSASPAPAVLTDAEPADSALDGAAEEEEHHTTLSPTVQDEAKSPASPVFGEQDTASVAESQTPTPDSSTSSVAVLWDIADCIAREVLMEVLAAQKIRSQQPAEQQDQVRSVAVARTETAHEVWATDSSKDEAPAAQPALAEEEEWEENSDKELSQGEDFTINTIWVNPLVPELFQDPHAGPQEGPSSKGEGAAGEPQSASPAPAVLTDAEPADSALDGAAEEEEHHTTLSPTVQDEAKSPASPVFGEQDTASVAESQTPTPDSSTSSVAVLWDIADCIAREVLMEVLAAQKIRSQQPAEQQDQVRSVAVARTETAHEVWATDSSKDEAPAAQLALAEEEEWEENSDKELSQGEDFTINTIWVNPLVPELFQDPHAGPQEGPSSKGEGAAGEPQSASPAPAVLTDAEPADSALDGAAEEEGHHALLDPAVQDEAKKSPASPVFGEQDTAAAAAESQTPTPHSSTGSAVAPWDIANCIVKEVLMEALAAKQPPSQQPAEQPDRAQSVDAVMAPRTPAGPQDSESPLAREPQAEASTALLVPAACEDGEDTASPMAGEHQEEASSTVASQAVQQDEVASSSPPNPLADAGVPHLAPAVDEEGEAAGSPLAQDPQYQAASEHRGDAQQSSGPSDVPEDDSGIATLPHAPARRRWPSLFRRVLRALRRAFHSACVAGQQEQ